MSYCRWSSDDFACDLYAYALIGGSYVISVASQRVVGAVPTVDWAGFEAERIDAATLAAQQAAQIAFVLSCERAPIGLPHDGKRFFEPTLAAFRARLAALRDAGYRCPAEVFAMIDEEQRVGRRWLTR